MKVGVFHSHWTPEQQNVLAAFAEGVQVAGADEVFIAHAMNGYQPCDVAVIYGLVKWTWRTHPYAVSDGAHSGFNSLTVAGARLAVSKPCPAFATPPSGQKASIIAKHPDPRRVLVIERGSVQPDRYWSAGWGGIVGEAFPELRTMTLAKPDRWESLGVRRAPWRLPMPGAPIIVAGQVPWDVTCQDHDHAAWCGDVLHRLLRNGLGLPVVFRPHPMLAARGGVKGWPIPRDVEVSWRPLAEDLARAAGVVTWNSTIGVDAVIAGVPVVAEGPGSMVSALASRYPDNAGDWLYRHPERAWWANNLAHTQWTLEEYRSGAAWADLRERIPGGFVNA